MSYRQLNTIIVSSSKQSKKNNWGVIIELSYLTTQVQGGLG
jgi:hypothetical protein